MMVLYDEEEIMRSYVESERHEAQEKARYEKRFLRMRKFSYDDIAAGSGLSIKEVEELADELQIV